MKETRSRLPLLLGAALAVAGAALSATAGTAAQLMTQGKLAADLGDHRAAEQAFVKLVADPAAPEASRAEALVRLGVVQRALGKTEASAAAFRQAMLSPGRDAQVTRLLALAVAGVAPDRTRWASQWPKVRLAAKPEAADSPPSIQWPGPGPQGLRQVFPARDPVSFDLEDVSLTAFLYKLLTGNPPGRPVIPFANWPESYQPPAGVQSLEFVISVGSFPDPLVTVKAASQPWNELFENVLASTGLGFRLEENLLFIAPAEDLGVLGRIRGRAYGGPSVKQTFLSRDVWDVFHLYSGITGVQLVPDARLDHRSFALRVSGRPAMQVLDLVLVSNDLAATASEPPPDAKPGTRAWRICRLADAGGDALDLSKWAPAP